MSPPGIIENGHKLGQGVPRVLWLALETRACGRIPCLHPAFAWLAEHTADVLTKYLAGKTGHSAYDRLFVKAVRAEALGVGENLGWRPPHTTSHNVLMEPRWRAGSGRGSHGAPPSTSCTFQNDEVSTPGLDGPAQARSGALAAGGGPSGACGAAGPPKAGNRR